MMQTTQPLTFGHLIETLKGFKYIKILTGHKTLENKRQESVLFYYLLLNTDLNHLIAGNKMSSLQSSPLKNVRIYIRIKIK